MGLLKHGEGTVERRGDRFRARWVDADGRRRSRTFVTEVEARVFLLGRDRTKAEPVPLSVEEVVRDYLRRGARRWQPATLVTYRQRAEAHILPHLGNVPLDRLTTTQVQRWVDTLDDAGLAAGTIQPVHAVLSGALAEAVRLGEVERNVASGVRLPVAREQWAGRAWSREQAQAVLAVAAGDARWHAVYQLMLNVGLRPGELRALQWNDVDWGQARLAVRRTVAKAASTAYETVRPGTKRGSGRTVPLPLPVLRALEVWRGAQRIAPPVGRHAGTSDEPVYLFGFGSWLDSRTWRDAHARICAAAGVPVIRLHDLRHTCASLLLARGVHAKVVGELLGHKGIATTLDIYSHVATDLTEAAAAGLADWLSAEQVSSPATTSDAKTG